MVPVSLPAIDLAITGEDLMLVGRFDHWKTVALDESSPDDGAAQVLVDVTGTAPAGGDALFSFASRSVERLSDAAYMARGVMRRGDVEHWTHALVQTPVAHTPFVMITFNVHRPQLGEVWEGLGHHVGVEAAHPEMARAWLRPPVLAAA